MALVHSGDIEVARWQGGTRLQLLALKAWQSMNFAPAFHAEDVNFHGYLDIAVLAAFAGQWRSGSWWPYDSVSGTFIQNELTRELRNLKPTESGSPRKRRRSSLLKSRIVAALRRTVAASRTIISNHLVVVHREVPDPQPGRCIVTWDRVGEALWISSVCMPLPSKG